MKMSTWMAATPRNKILQTAYESIDRQLTDDYVPIAELIHDDGDDDAQAAQAQ